MSFDYADEQRRKRWGADIDPRFLPKWWYSGVPPWEKVHAHQYELWVQNDVREIKAWLEGRKVEPWHEALKAEGEELRKRRQRLEQEDAKMREGWGDVKEVDETE